MGHLYFSLPPDGGVCSQEISDSGAAPFLFLSRTGLEVKPPKRLAIELQLEARILPFALSA
jgi:hypothetical protein